MVGLWLALAGAPIELVVELAHQIELVHLPDLVGQPIRQDVVLGPRRDQRHQTNQDGRGTKTDTGVSDNA